MSLPQLLAKVLIQGTTIVGRAFAEAGRQAMRNARAVQSESAAQEQGPAKTAGAQLTRTHRMTLEEARMILNIKPQEGEAIEEFQARLQKSYDHLYAVNAPPAPKGKEGGGSGSFYMQSKVVRARQRIEAEWAQPDQGEQSQQQQQQQQQSQSQPPPTSEQPHQQQQQQDTKS